MDVSHWCQQERERLQEVHAEYISNATDFAVNKMIIGSAEFQRRVCYQYRPDAVCKNYNLEQDMLEREECRLIKEKKELSRVVAELDEKRENFLLNLKLYRSGKFGRFLGLLCS